MMNLQDSAEAPLSICLAQIGARRHYAVPAFLHRHGLLKRFYTDIHADSNVVRYGKLLIPKRFMPASFKRLAVRRIPEIPRSLIRDFPGFGVKRIWRARRSNSFPETYSNFLTANREFGKLVVDSGFDSATAVYVFNGAGVEIIDAAKRDGMKVIVEQTAADLSVDEEMLANEREKWPGWELEDVSQNDWIDLAERESYERSMADLVICGSEHVRQSIEIAGCSVDNCDIVPYGFHDGASENAEMRIDETSVKDGLNVLFAGTLCLRKGVPYLVQAAKELKKSNVNFRVLGPSAVSEKAIEQVKEVADYRGVATRSEMADHYRWADVFLFPTLSEGSANVCYEALSAGLPVVTTMQSGSVIRDQTDGFIVPSRDSNAIVEKLGILLSDHSLRRQMSCNASMRAQEYTWERYEKRLIESLMKRIVCGGT